MSKDKANTGSGSKVSEQSTAQHVTERRKRLAQLIGHLLAQNWLEQRRQTEKDGDDESA